MSTIYDKNSVVSTWTDRVIDGFTMGLVIGIFTGFPLGFVMFLWALSEPIGKG